MSKQALEMALEALETLIYESSTHDGNAYCSLDAINTVNAERAITVIKEALAQPDRHELQAKGEHPAPCARFCEANAFQIEIRSLKAKLAQPEDKKCENCGEFGECCLNKN